MTYKNLISLYKIDKKICQMICDLEGINKNFNAEFVFLDTLERFAKSQSEIDSALREQERFQRLLAEARKLIDSLLSFKCELDSYQVARSRGEAMKDFIYTQNITKELERRSENPNSEDSNMGGDK